MTVTPPADLLSLHSVKTMFQSLAETAEKWICTKQKEQAVFKMPPEQQRLSLLLILQTLLNWMA